MHDQQTSKLSVRPIQTTPAPMPITPHTFEVGGKLYKITPAESQAQGITWGWVAFAVAGGILAGAVPVILLAQYGAITVAPPEVIERPVVVPTTVKPRCLAFCGDS